MFWAHGTVQSNGVRDNSVAARRETYTLGVEARNELVRTTKSVTAHAAVNSARIRPVRRAFLAAPGESERLLLRETRPRCDSSFSGRYLQKAYLFVRENENN